MYTLSEILWSTTGELNFERAYIRLRRQCSIYERDWRRLPLYFDYEIEEQSDFLERRKIAKQLCWHWLQLELNCTYRASTSQELSHIPKDAQILWLNDQLVDDGRITYYLGKDKFDPQCVEEIFLKGLATPLYRFRQQEWILLPPWIQVLDNNGYLVFFDLSHPLEKMMLHSLWKGKILAERFVCLDNHPMQYLENIPPLDKIQSIYKKPVLTSVHHHHYRDLFAGKLTSRKTGLFQEQPQEVTCHQENPKIVQDIQELLRMLCTHPPEQIVPEFHPDMIGFALSFAIGHLYETPLTEVLRSQSIKKVKQSICIQSSRIEFYDLILLVCVALVSDMEIWIDIDNSSCLSTNNTAAILAQHASRLHLPLYLGRNDKVLQIDRHHIPIYLQCALWTGGDVNPLLQDIMFLEGKSRYHMHSVFVHIDQLENLLDNLAENMHTIQDINPISGKEDPILFSYVSKRGQVIEINEISVGISDISTFTPFRVPKTMMIYTFSSLTAVTEVLHPWKFALETLFYDHIAFFHDIEKRKEMPHLEHLSQLQELFSQIGLMGLLHQRHIREQFTFL